MLAHATPKFMKAALASSFGDAADVLTVSPSVAQPGDPRKHEVQILVYACSLSPSDYRMLSGDADLVKKPSSWPYIPGGDVSGVVVKAASSCRKTFHPGDRVMGTWDTFGVGALAEYINVHESYVEHIPVITTQDGVSKQMTFIDAAAVVDSSVNAMLAMEDAQVRAGDNVLILGGSGSVGTSLLQLLRHKNVSHIVTTSTDEALVKKLGADICVDYTKEDWWMSDIVKQHAPYDVVIDCAEGVKAWNIVREHDLVKTRQNGGRFLAVVVNDWHIEVHSIMDLFAFMWPPLKRTVQGWWYKDKMASYKMLFPAPRGDSLKRLLSIVGRGELDVVVDKRGPHPFTTEGVREAFDIMVRRKGHGKVVIKIRDEDE